MQQPAYGAPSPYGAPPMPSHYGAAPSGPSPYGPAPGGYGAPRPADAGQVETYMMEVPGSIIGLIIGRAGEKIKEMQDQSGASIQVGTRRLLAVGSLGGRSVGFTTCALRAKHTFSPSFH